MVCVQGRIQTGSYQDKDGKTVYTTDVIADRVEFLEWGDRPQQSAGSGSFSQAPEVQSGEDLEAEMPDSFLAINEDIPF